MQSSYHPDDELTNDVQPDAEPLGDRVSADEHGPFVWAECAYCPATYKHRPWSRKPICNACWQMEN